MTKPLTDTQRAILRDAAAHPHGLATPPPHLPPAPRTAVAKALLGAGLLARADGAEGQHPGLGWKLDGDSVLLRITAAGLQAIGAAPAAAAPEPQEALVAEPPAQAATAGEDGAPVAAAPPPDAPRATAASEAAQGASEAPQRPTPRQALRGAAQAALAAWDGAPSDERAALEMAVEELRTALAEPAAARSTSGPRQPRAGTKQAAVLTLLRRPEGASEPQIIAATGWAPHTVRGFLAGLKKRGVAVAVLERVRQAGPGKEGAKGSYTVYRVAEAD
jgi:hypothetical protein